jgi:hypothetical protein
VYVCVPRLCGLCLTHWSLFLSARTQLGTVNITVVDASGQTANLKMSLAQAYGAHIMLKHAYPHMYAIDETLVPVMAQEANEDDHRW